MRLREFLALEQVEEAEGNLDQEVTGDPMTLAD